MQPATVFVIDDDPAVRDSISALVEVRGVPVRSYSTAEAFLADLPDDRPGCVVTDIRLENGMSGIDLQRVLRDRGSQMPVVVISAYANVSNAVQAMHQGAVTLLEKSCSTEELWAAISEALRRDAEARSGKVHISDVLAKFKTLTDDEISVMVRIVGGVLNKVIAKDLSISLRTVESRRASVLKKIDVTSIPELVRLYFELESAYGRKPEELLGNNSDHSR